MINKIKNYFGEHPLSIGICIALMIVIILSNILAKDMEEHIERVSKKCASKGYDIEAIYTKDGDQFYVCNKDGDK